MRVRQAKRLFVYLFIIYVVLSTIALARGVPYPVMQECMPTKELAAILKKAGESAVSFGPSDINKSIVMIYRKKDRSTWSVVEHYHTGLSCFLMIGKNWQFINPFNMKVIPQPEGKDL